MTGAAPQLLLASASPRRSALLAQIGISHRVAETSVDETPLPEEAPGDLVQRLACQKALAGITLGAGLPALGADTIVVLQERVYGKPRDAEDAQAMLLSLAGGTHRVLSAVALARPDGTVSSRMSASRVRMGQVTPEQARWYWQTGEPRDKAGGYAIQGLGAVFVAELSGSYSGVMGLPLYETAQLLCEAGIRPGIGSRA